MKIIAEYIKDTFVALYKIDDDLRVWVSSGILLSVIATMCLYFARGGSTPLTHCIVDGLIAGFGVTLTGLGPVIMSVLLRLFVFIFSDLRVFLVVTLVASHIAVYYYHKKGDAQDEAMCPPQIFGCVVGETTLSQANEILKGMVAYEDSDYVDHTLALIDKSFLGVTYDYIQFSFREDTLFCVDCMKDYHNEGEMLMLFNSMQEGAVGKFHIDEELDGSKILVHDYGEGDYSCYIGAEYGGISMMYLANRFVPMEWERIHRKKPNKTNAVNNAGLDVSIRKRSPSSLYDAGVSYSGNDTEKYSHADSVTTVYICSSPNAYAYHRTIRCGALTRCRYDVEEITRAEAKKRHRTPCGKCY